eukprot:scaffold952_cov249-Pinguiococcus_pyrenoidosus.AAC.2
MDAKGSPLVLPEPPMSRIFAPLSNHENRPGQSRDGRRPKSLGTPSTRAPLPAANVMPFKTPQPQRVEDDRADAEFFECRDGAEVEEVEEETQGSPAEALAREMRRLSMELGSLGKRNMASTEAFLGSENLDKDMPIYSENELAARIATAAHQATQSLRAELEASFKDEKRTLEGSSLAARDALSAEWEAKMDEALQQAKLEAAERHRAELEGEPKRAWQLDWVLCE